MIVDLTKPESLPDSFASKLKALESDCRVLRFSEELFAQSCVRPLVREIDSFCASQKIVGVHYTRALPESIFKHGLLIRTGEEVRTTFLNEHGHLFSDAEKSEIKNIWHRYFDTSQSSIRDNRIFFNFTETALYNGGAESLLGMYGGEQINMCFDPEHPIGEKLTRIGVPLMVKCALHPGAVETFTEYPWGKILVSAYHLMINPEAHGFDQDGYQSSPVKPDDIISASVQQPQ